MAVSAEAWAQYDEPPDYKPLELRTVYAGFLQRSFSPRPTNMAPDSAVIDFTRAMPMIGFRQGPLDIVVGYTSYDFRGSSRSHILFAASASQDFPLAFRRPHALLLPFMVSIDFTKSEVSGQERDNFNIASVGFGMGLAYRYFREGLDLSFRVAEAVHYSSEGLSAGSGFSAATLGEALFVFSDVSLLDGIVVGYRFRYQTWAMNNDRFNYRSVSHGPFVGVVF